MVTMPSIPEILPTYQLPAIAVSRAEFEGFAYRDDEAEFSEGTPYRTREGYQNDIFFWVAVPGAEGGGEWRRAPAAFTD